MVESLRFLRIVIIFEIITEHRRFVGLFGSLSLSIIGVGAVLAKIVLI